MYNRRYVTKSKALQTPIDPAQRLAGARLSSTSPLRPDGQTWINIGWVVQLSMDQLYSNRVIELCCAPSDSYSKH